MPGENGQVGETGEVVEQVAELSLREELAKNLADLKGDPVDTPVDVPVEKTVETPAEPKTSDTPESKAAPTEVTPPAESKAKAPQSWSAAEKEVWSKIPPEGQAVIARREEEAHRGITALGQDAALGKKLKDVINPYLPMIRAEGGDEAGAVRDLLQTAYILRTGNPAQKAEVMRHVAGLYGVDLAVAAQGVQQVNPEVHQLQTKIAQFEARFANAEQQQHQQVQGQAQTIIDTFAADPKNEYYEQVKPVMAQLLVGGIAKDMQEAYDMACHANPDVRSTILTRQTADAEAKRAAEAKAKADAKRRAAGSISGSPAGTVSTTTTANQNLSLREELRQQLRAATNS